MPDQGSAYLPESCYSIYLCMLQESFCDASILFIIRISMGFRNFPTEPPPVGGGP